MHISYFLIDFRKEIEDFYDYYMRNYDVNGKNFPLEMEYSEWFEQFIFYMENKNE